MLILATLSLVPDPQKVVDETKKRIKAVQENTAFVNTYYFKGFEPELEFVLGVTMPDELEITKKILKKGGGIKVWSAGNRLNSNRPELTFVRPWEANDIGKTMFHKNKVLNQKLENVQTSWEFKSIFPESHPFAKLRILAWVKVDENGSFMLDDLLEIIKVELEYLETDRIRKYSSCW
ncbi:MAG TPA: hypothetical protein VE130_15995 [Nitrososphaeraceae archaeon]|nr:hypothetical protein [Nitrososphaeraceae archaeon]